MESASESKEIPATAVASTAKIMATRWLWISLIPGVVALLFALTLIAGQTSPRHHSHGVAVTIAAYLICVAPPGLLAIWFLVRARGYAMLAKVAADDPTLRWHLTGKLLAAARDGVPRPELAFRIAGYLRRSLIAVPRATLVQ